MTTVWEPTPRHCCAPPEHRPKDEWRSMPVPPGWRKPKDRFRDDMHAKIPTPYPPGTVWVCACGKGWVKGEGRHYGRNPNFGHLPGNWYSVCWWHFRIRRRIDQAERAQAYERAKLVVDGFVLQ